MTEGYRPGAAHSLGGSLDLWKPRGRTTGSPD